MKTAKEIENDSKEIFLKQLGFGDEIPLRLEMFYTFLCPVAMAEAMVKEHIVEDFDALELLVLRLYEAGFHSIEDMVSLSGMNKAMVERALNNEINVYHHIDSRGEITEMGRRTLEENANGNSVSHTMYDTPRRMQIEAVTGTVIPSYLEEKVEYMKSILEEKAFGIVPKATVEYDEELKNEINARLQEYKHMGILNEGETITGISNIHSTQIYYRWSYLVRFQGMVYPMIVMRGRKTISNVGSQSVKKGDYGKKVVVPLALSFSDAEFLKEHGIVFDDVIVRDDSVFDYLFGMTFNLNTSDVDEDISMESSEVIYEDEKVLETEEIDE